MNQKHSAVHGTSGAHGSNGSNGAKASSGVDGKIQGLTPGARIQHFWQHGQRTLFPPDRPVAAWQLLLVGVFALLFVPSVFVDKGTVPATVQLALFVFLTATASVIFLKRFLLVGISLTLGLLVASAHLGLFALQQVRLTSPTDFEVTVRVVSIPDSSYRRARAVVAIEDGEICTVRLLPCRVRLSWYRSKHVAVPELVPGQRWRLTIRAKPPRGYANPGGFDYARWLHLSGIHATAYVRAREPVVELSASRSGWVNRFRLRVIEAIDGVLDTHPQQGLVLGLAVGVRDGISQPDRQTLIDTGTAHLLAISGMHIGMVAGLAFALGGLLWRSVVSLATLSFGRDRRFAGLNRWPGSGKAWQVNPSEKHGSKPTALAQRVFANQRNFSNHRKRVATVCALSAALAYALLAGFTLPTQRALLTLIAVSGLFFSARSVSFRHILLLVLCSALLLDPLAPLSAGIWLSFGAVLALIWVGAGRERVAPDAPIRRRLWLRFYTTVRVQLALSLLMIPLTIGFFGQLSLIAPLANLIAIPWVGLLILPLLMAGLAAILFNDALAAWLLLQAAEGLQLLLDVLRTMQGMPFASIALPQPGIAVLLLAVAGFMCATKPAGGRLRWLAVPLCLPLLTPFLVIKNQNPRVYVLDVGQGLSVVVATANHVLLYDTGPGWRNFNGSGFSTFQSVVVPFLKTEGLGPPDLAIISHSDNDHAGGLADLRASYPQTVVATPIPFLAELDADKACQRGDSWVWDEVEFTVLHPGQSDGSTVNRADTDNNLSCVLLISYGESRILLPGDIEGRVESGLSGEPGLQIGDNGTSSFHYDLLVAPHHGSGTSSTPEFVALTRPEHVVFAVGWANRYGFPDASVVMRYKSVGSNIYQTGALTFEFDSQGLVGTARQFRFR